MSEADVSKYVIHCKKTILDLSVGCRIMGIVNCTPDSFSEQPGIFRPERAVSQAMKLISEGADIVDIGGESTRPGANDVSVDEECSRVIPVIEAVRQYSDVPVSIDTRKSRVADEALRCGADIINDVSALGHDAGMAATARQHGAPVVLMHMQGTPATMQSQPQYGNVVQELLEFFREREAFCTQEGVSQIVFDPGIGFGKRLRDNLALLHSLPLLCALGRPVLVGTSRKSFLGAITGRSVGDRLAGTIASNVLAFFHGAHILRVHDVKEIRDAIRVAAAIMSESGESA